MQYKGEYSLSPSEYSNYNIEPPHNMASHKLAKNIYDHICFICMKELHEKDSGQMPVDVWLDKRALAKEAHKVALRLTSEDPKYLKKASGILNKIATAANVEPMKMGGVSGAYVCFESLQALQQALNKVLPPPNRNTIQKKPRPAATGEKALPTPSFSQRVSNAPSPSNEI